MTVRELIAALLPHAGDEARLVMVLDPIDGGRAEVTEVAFVCRCPAGDPDFVELLP